MLTLVSTGICNGNLLAHNRQPKAGLCSAIVSFFLNIYFFLTISVKSIISTSTKPIFANFQIFGSTTAVDDQSDISFLTLQGILPWS